jgi:hypothetical protein
VRPPDPPQAPVVAEPSQAERPAPESTGANDSGRVP